MTPTFIVQFDSQGRMEPAFCTACDEFQEHVVFFLTSNIDTALCDDCIRRAAKALLDALDLDAASRA